MDQKRGMTKGIVIGVETFNYPSYNLITILLGFQYHVSLIIGNIYVLIPVFYILQIRLFLFF